MPSTHFTQLPLLVGVNSYVFFLFLIFITKFKYTTPEKKFDSLNGFIEDDFNQQNSIDLLNRDRYARQIAIKILDTQATQRAFVIAVNSPWGYGKSAFLMMIENFFLLKSSEMSDAVKAIKLYDEGNINHLIYNHKNTIIVRYNPWKNFDDKKTLQDFFDEFSASIKKYDSQLSKKIKTYGSVLYKLDDSNFRKIIEATVDIFQDTQSQTKLFKNINKSIETIQKRIIVFIDDLDRLTGDELFDILKLIRNTADFKNTFFITAYDHNYVLNTIDKKGLISNKEEYLHKIVQLEITLPMFNKNILIQFLKDEIKKHEIFSHDLEVINMAINEIFSINVTVVNDSNQDDFDLKNSIDISNFLSNSQEGRSLIFEILRNIRDVVRFINSFKLTYELIGKFGDVYEIIMLDFLKIKFLSIYQLVANKSLLTIKNGEYTLDINQFETLNDNQFNVLNLKVSDRPIIKKILEEIFDSKRKRFFRSVKGLKYFDFYFTYKIPELNLLEKIEKALSENIDEVIKVINESEEQNILDDLRNFLDSQEDFDTIEFFQIFLQTLFYIAKFDHNTNYNTVSQIQNILRDKSILEKHFSSKKDKYSDLLLSILKDKRFDLTARSEIAGEELYKIVNRSDDNETVFIIVNDKNSLQKILLDCLEDLIISKRSFDNQVVQMYIRNLEDILPGSRRIIITEGANNLMNKLILDNPYQYIKEYFLRQHPEPSFEGSFYHLDPFLLNYFHDDWNLVMELLRSPSVKKAFEINDEEKRFYEYLFEAVELAKDKKDFKFIIEDPEKIELVDKFITIKPRRITTRLGTSSDEQE